MKSQHPLPHPALTIQQQARLDNFVNSTIKLIIRCDIILKQQYSQENTTQCQILMAQIKANFDKFEMTGLKLPEIVRQLIDKFEPESEVLAENQLITHQFQCTILDQMDQFQKFFDQKSAVGIEKLKSSLNEKIGVFKQSGLEIPEVVRKRIQELKVKIKQFDDQRDGYVQFDNKQQKYAQPRQNVQQKRVVKNFHLLEDFQFQQDLVLVDGVQPRPQPAQEISPYNFQQTINKLPQNHQVMHQPEPDYQQIMEQYTQQYYQIHDLLPDFTPQKILSALKDNLGIVERAIDTLMMNQEEHIQPDITMNIDMMHEYEPKDLLRNQKKWLEYYRKFVQIKDMGLPINDKEILSALDHYNGDTEMFIDSLFSNQLDDQTDQSENSSIEHQYEDQEYSNDILHDNNNEQGEQRERVIGDG